MPRLIAHVDMDCFFAAVEVLDDPSLRGRPVIVGADPQGGKGRGVVSAASYEARKFGVHSAMPVSRAFALCPQGVFLPGRMGRYSEISGKIMEILKGFTPQIEQISVDEAFLDLSGCQRLFGEPREIARKIKTAIKSRLSLTASVGMGSNKLVAKIASDLQKPDGLVIVPSGEEKEFLALMPSGKLWGVGPKTADRLKQMGLETIGQLAEYDPKRLETVFGKMGTYLHERANAIDNDAVSQGYQVKSMGREHTYDEDTGSKEDIHRMLLTLSEQVAASLRAEGVKGRTITLKLRYQDFETHTYGRTLETAVDNAIEINAIARMLFDKNWQTFRKIRLIGVSASNLNQGEDQLGLFDDPKKKIKNEKLDKAVDEIRERYGRKAVKRAGEM
jgi:nucleotidyltransferase/DNA polymerase involved in DNA repair